MHVFLIHGMGRTRSSMSQLAKRLGAAGHDVSTFGYFVTRDSLDAIASKWRGHIDKELSTKSSGSHEFAVIGHSLGNIVTRMLLPLEGLVRFIMLAPPNQPPIMARTLGENPLFRALTKDAGQKLVDAAFYARLPVPTVPTLIVAGTRGPRATWLPFRGQPSDGVVRVEETRLPGVPHVEVPAIHTFIMNDAEVASLALRFIEHGSLATPQAPR